MAKIFIGTSGFYYDHWKDKFYPKDLKKDQWLSYYAKKFSTVEINSSFYHTPRLTTVANWIKKVPADFIFSFKLSRFITHRQQLRLNRNSLDIFFQPLEPVTRLIRKPLILIQTPSILTKNIERLDALLSRLSKKFLYAVEFRHPSWFTEEVYETLRKYNVALVLSDSPVINSDEGSADMKFLRLGMSAAKGGQGTHRSQKFHIKLPRLWPYANINTATFFYLRFHGSRQLFTSSYTDKELQYYAQLIKTKQKQGLDVYAYFNNDTEGYAIKNAFRLKELL